MKLFGEELEQLQRLTAGCLKDWSDQLTDAQHVVQELAGFQDRGQTAAGIRAYLEEVYLQQLFPGILMLLEKCGCVLAAYCLCYEELLDGGGSLDTDWIHQRQEAAYREADWSVIRRMEDQYLTIRAAEREGLQNVLDLEEQISSWEEREKELLARRDAFPGYVCTEETLRNSVGLAGFRKVWSLPLMTETGKETQNGQCQSLMTDSQATESRTSKEGWHNRFQNCVHGKQANRLLQKLFAVLRAESRFCMQQEDPQQAEERRERNRILFEQAKNVVMEDGYIEYQEAFTEENQAQLEYGDFTVAYSGCEVIAVYNALRDLDAGTEPSFPDLLRHFEMDGMMADGRFGTDPAALAEYFRGQGYETEISYEAGDRIAFSKRYDILILTYWNDRNEVEQGIHTVEISRNEGGHFTIHNIETAVQGHIKQEKNGSRICGSTRWYADLDTALQEQQADPQDQPALVSLIGINRRKQESGNNVPVGEDPSEWAELERLER